MDVYIRFLEVGVVKDTYCQCVCQKGTSSTIKLLISNHPCLYYLFSFS